MHRRPTGDCLGCARPVAVEDRFEAPSSNDGSRTPTSSSRVHRRCSPRPLIEKGHLARSIRWLSSQLWRGCRHLMGSPESRRVRSRGRPDADGSDHCPVVGVGLLRNSSPKSKVAPCERPSVTIAPARPGASVTNGHTHSRPVEQRALAHEPEPRARTTSTPSAQWWSFGYEWKRPLVRTRRGVLENLSPKSEPDR